MSLKLSDFQSDYQHFVVQGNGDNSTLVLDHISKHYAHIKYECYEWLEDISLCQSRLK